MSSDSLSWRHMSHEVMELMKMAPQLLTAIPRPQFCGRSILLEYNSPLRELLGLQRS